MTRLSLVKTKGQSALDSAGLAAVISADTVDVRSEAQNFFNHNLNALGAPQNANFGAVQVAQAGDEYTFTTTGNMPFALIQLFGGNAGQEINLTTVVSRTTSPFELSLIMDTSLNMNQPAGGGLTRLDAAKQAANGLIDKLFPANGAAVPGVVSLVSFSDAVKIGGQEGRAWMQNPPTGSNYNGCFAKRPDTSNSAPTSIASKFDRYRGPFDVSNKVKVDFTNLLYSGSNWNHGSPAPIGYTTQDRPDGSIRMFLNDTAIPADITTRVNLALAQRGTYGTAYDGGRLRDEIDYIHYDHNGTLVNKAEYLRLDFGAEYLRSFPQFIVRNMCSKENIRVYGAFQCNSAEFTEAGRISAYNSNNQRLNYLEFTSVGNSALCEVIQRYTPTGNALAGTRYFQIEPLNAFSLDDLSGNKCGPANEVCVDALIKTHCGTVPTPASVACARDIWTNFMAKHVKANSVALPPICYDILGGDVASKPNLCNVAGATPYSDPSYCLYRGFSQDNSDFSVQTVDYKPVCAVAPSHFFMTSRQSMRDQINALTADGPARIPRGMEWGWYSLSPQWRGFLKGQADLANPSTPAYPKNKGETRKVAVLMTQGSNFNPVEDNARLAQVCTAMKTDGVTIYTIAFNVVDATQRNILRQCASTADFALTASNANQLKDRFQSVAGSLTRPRIMR